MLLQAHQQIKDTSNQNKYNWIECSKIICSSIKLYIKSNVDDKFDNKISELSYINLILISNFKLDNMVTNRIILC